MNTATSERLIERTVRPISFAPRAPPVGRDARLDVTG